MRYGKKTASKAGAALTVILLISMTVCLIIAFLPGGLALTGGRNSGGNLTIKQRTFYAVNGGSCISENEALTLAMTVQSGGGAGYIKNDGKFQVLVWAYPQKSAAENVLSRYPQYSYYELKSPKLSLDKPANLKDALNYPVSEMFDELYSIINQLDKSEISESYAVYIAQNIQRQLSQYKLMLEADTSGIEALVAAYDDITDGFENVFEYGYTVSSRLRKFTLFALDTYINALIKY